MTERLQYALCELDDLELSARGESPLHRLDARAKLLTTGVYLLVMLSVPLTRLSEILLYALFPLLTAMQAHIRLATLLRRSLAVLPFAALIGIFNLFYDRTPLFRIGPLVVTAGATTFAAILLRGLLSMQALLLLIGTTGFYGICRALQQAGAPRFFTTQLLFVYRYLRLMIDEALRMSQACRARSFGRRHPPLRVWGPMIGQLLLRTFDRAEQIHRAMAARGFTGRMPDLAGRPPHWRWADTLFLGGWSAALLLARCTCPVETLTRLFL